MRIVIVGNSNKQTNERISEGTMKSISKRNHDRAAGMVAVSISMPEDIMNKLTEIAEANDRSRSNMFVAMTREHIEKTWLALQEKKRGTNSH